MKKNLSIVVRNNLPTSLRNDAISSLLQNCKTMHINVSLNVALSKAHVSIGTSIVLVFDNIHFKRNRKYISKPKPC